MKAGLSPRNAFGPSGALAIVMLAPACLPAYTDDSVGSMRPAVGSANATALGDIVLVDRALSAGLNKVGYRGHTWHSAGVAFTDLDGDHWPDLYFGGSAGDRDELCINQHDGSFSCARVDSPPNAGDVLAIAAGDYDGDGRVDLYLMRNGKNSLLRNLGSGLWADVTDQTNAGGSLDAITTTGSFFDEDGDGRLDLYLGHWYASEPTTSAADQVLHQRADGVFEDRTASSGINDHLRSTLAMISFDANHDGRPDIYLTSDFDEALLFLSDGGGRFTDVTARQALEVRRAVLEGMGIDVADVNGDGDADLYVTGNRYPGISGSALLLNSGGSFRNATAAYGIDTEFAWGTGLVDFDNDGWPDVLSVTDMVDHYYLFHNDRGQRFLPSPTSPPASIDPIHDCVTVAFADYDRDGRVDAVVHRMGGQRPELLHNETSSGHWIQLEPGALAGVIGTKVRVRAGGRMQERELISQSSKGAVSDRVFSFGVGSVDRVDIEIEFPDGHQVSMTAAGVDRRYEFDRGALHVVDRNGVAAAGCEVGVGRRPSRGASLALIALWLLPFVGGPLLRQRRRRRDLTRPERATER